MIGRSAGLVRDHMLRGRVDRRGGRGDQFFGARDIGFACGSGEQSAVTDAMEPLWQNVQQEALMNSFGMSVIVPNRARPLRR